MKRQTKNSLIVLAISAFHLSIAGLLLSYESAGVLTSLATVFLVLAGIGISAEILFVSLLISALHSYINWRFDHKLAELVCNSFKENALLKNHLAIILWSCFM